MKNFAMMGVACGPSKGEWLGGWVDLGEVGGRI